MKIRNDTRLLIKFMYYDPEQRIVEIIAKPFEVVELPEGAYVYINGIYTEMSKED